MTPQEMYDAPKATLRARRIDIAQRQLPACISESQRAPLEAEISRLDRAIALNFDHPSKSAIVQYIATGSLRNA